MFWKHLKKSTPEQEAEFQERMSNEKVTWKDKLAMVLAAFLTILLPCALVVTVLGLLILWMFGAM